MILLRIGKGLRAFETALCAVALFGCSDVLGIDEATCDPAVSECSGAASQTQTLCEQYCDAVEANCTGEFEVYVGRETCLSVCSYLPEGEEGDEGVNSVHCRLNQAHVVLTTGEPETHCPGAGPGGGPGPGGGEALCGGNCEGLCSIMLGACDEYDSFQDCLDECAEVPELEGYSTAQTTGDSQQCRLWHASAATQSTIPHCLHAAGASPCK